ncbi:MAG TPA: lytic transglycosylase domain-containing protein [Mycobacteriales bacterium]|nr:lytic transglycosylase domain-containing protein [Mycobacteriales bacterium]
MRTLSPLRRARGLALLGALTLVVGVAPSAHADATGDAQARAHQILARVQALQAKVKQAEQAYDRTLAGVAASVNASVLSDRSQSAVAAQAAAASTAVTDQVRGLYMSGGPLALYATLLTSGSVVEFQNGAAMVDRVVAAGRTVVEQNDAVVARAEQQARQASRTASRRIRTERSVARVATKVLSLLQEQQALLDRANAQVAHLQALDAARAALAAQNAAFSTITSTRIAQLQVLPPSPTYLALYHHAADTCSGLSWTVLAAIGQVESGHGRNPSTSYAGAMGPMQFLPSTFQSYGVDGDHDGQLDIMDPADAIFTAAHYLCANGAGRGSQALSRAIWHYNHADWYVQMVLTLAGRYAA